MANVGYVWNRFIIPTYIWLEYFVIKNNTELDMLYLGNYFDVCNKNKAVIDVYNKPNK